MSRNKKKISLVEKPIVTRKDIKGVFDTLISDRLTTLEGGIQLELAEKKFSKLFSDRNAAMFINDSAALFCLLKYLGVSEGDKVYISSFAEPFIVETILFLNANPVYLDTNAKEPFMDIAKLEKVLKDNVPSSDKDANSTDGKSKKAIVIYSYIFGLGEPSRLKEWKERLANESSKDIVLIEDCVSALGSTYKDGEKWMPVGMVGDFTLFSFATKRMMTSAKGAMVLAKDSQDIKNIKLTRGGLQPKEKKGTSLLPKLFARLDFVPSELEASLALTQLSNLEKTLVKRKQIHEELLKNKSCNSFFAKNMLQFEATYRSNLLTFMFIFETAQMRRNAKEMFENTDMDGLREVEDIVYSMEYDSTVPVSNQTSKTNLPNTVDLISRMLTLSVPLDCNSKTISKLASFFGSLNKL